MTEGPTRVTRAGVARDHAVIARRQPGALAATALRTRSLHAREVLAEVAWPGHSPAELEAYATSNADHPRLPDGSEALGMADYARVVAVQLGTVADRVVARSLLEALAAHPGWEQVQRQHVEMLAQLRVLDGDPEGAIAVVDDPRVRTDVAAAVRADALNPRITPSADPTAWTETFTDALHGPALAPFLPLEGDGPPRLERLRVEARPSVDGPERVTVVMSTYRPTADLRTAVASVLAQTWTNLELIVVDDASGPGEDGRFAALLDEVEGWDARVRLVRKAVNGGTYRARNTALRLATGDFVTVLDSDDWLHPQTLELSVAPLLTHPRLMATRSEGVRVSADLVLTRPGYRPRVPTATTLLFRRVEVMRRLGFFDPTRKGADTEYARRLEAAFGSVIRDIPETTTIVRAGEATLSADEFGNGWRHPARHQYKSLYTPWHRRIAAGEATAYLDAEEPRALPEPLRWSRPTHPLRGPEQHLDLCLAGDWRRHGGPQKSMMEEISAARSAGLRVGIMHLEALRFMTTHDLPVNPVVLALVRSGEVAWVHPDDDVEIDVLMIRYPLILQYPPTLRRHVRARQVLVMANQAPAEADGADQRYVVRDVTERAAALFGAPVRWVPQSPAIRRLLTEQDPQVALTTWDNPGLIDPDEWLVRPGGAPGRDGRPIRVGRHSRDERIKFPPTWQETVQGYTFGPAYQVSMLGALNTLGRQRTTAGEGAAPVPDNWEIRRHGTQDVRDFLAGLDFYLYLDNPYAHEAFGRVLLEAAASGVLTIAHPKHRSTFGDLLDYAGPGEAQELIARYVADPDAYAARVEATLSGVRERYSTGSFADRIRRELGPRPGPQPVGAPPQDQAPAVVEVPMRSAADGSRADRVTITHLGVPDEVLRRWLAPSLRGWTAPSWEASALLAEAPDGVVSLTLHRDGLVWALGRGRWSGAPRDAELCALAGSSPPGWDDRAWWAVHPTPDIRLRQEVAP